MFSEPIALVLHSYIPSCISIDKGNTFVFPSSPQKHMDESFHDIEADYPQKVSLKMLSQRDHNSL